MLESLGSTHWGETEAGEERIQAGKGRGGEGVENPQ